MSPSGKPFNGFILLRRSLRGLEGVDLLDLFGGRFFYVGGHIAFPGAPLGGRFRKNQAVLAGGEILSLLAAAAGFDNSMAAATSELAAVLAHEKTLHTRLDRCTNHGDHVLSEKKLQNINRYRV
jgi:hypothetical protein